MLVNRETWEPEAAEGPMTAATACRTCGTEPVRVRDSVTAVAHPSRGATRLRGLAQRIESVAPSGGVMLSVSTARLVDGLAALAEPELVRIKGADEPMSTRRLLGIGDQHHAIGRPEPNLIGRQWEMVAVESLLQRAVDGHGAVLAVVGSPGIGRFRSSCGPFFRVEPLAVLTPTAYTRALTGPVVSETPRLSRSW